MAGSRVRWQPVVLVSAVLAIVAGAGLSYAGLRTAASGPPAAGAQAPRTVPPAEPTGGPVDPALPGTGLDPALPGLDPALPGLDPADVGASPSATADPEPSAEPPSTGEPSDPYPAWPPGGDEPGHPGRPPEAGPPVAGPPDTWQPPRTEEPPPAEEPPATGAPPTTEPSAPAPPVTVPPVTDAPAPGGAAYAEEPLIATLTQVTGVAAEEDLGYSGTVRIDNPGGQDRAGWRVTLTVLGGNPVESAGVSVAQDREWVTFTPAGAGPVPAGSSVTFSFDVRGVLPALPADCAIDGHPCS